MMKKHRTMRKLITLLCCMTTSMLLAQNRIVELTFLHTSDVHGSVFSYDYMKHRQTQSGLPFIYAYADSLQSELGERLILTDGGDCLQGQPAAYYSNYIDTTSAHVIASVMNQMHYVCTAMGNHDIETGHAVYDRWIRELNMPCLGANVIDTRTGEPYLTPYIIINRAGVRIAFLGMVTPAIPYWLPENLWENLRFENIPESSAKWMKVIQEREKPDLIVGVFHSGFSDGIAQDGCLENATELTARTVDGFDFILYGHDHRAAIQDVKTDNGKVVKCMGPTNAGTRFVQASVKLTYEGENLVGKEIDGKVLSTTDCLQLLGKKGLQKAQLFEADFVDERLALDNWVNKPIGMLTEDLVEADAYFGPSKFIDFIHQMQLELTGADVSFSAPLSFNTILNAGELTVNHMFNLYKFENMLYTMRLTGREIKGALEMSYGKWTVQMQHAEDHIMLLKDDDAANGKKSSFVNMTFNFDSAAGIIYEVDVTKPVGERVHIISMADGSPFSFDKEYRVAVNSYRGNGGGELLTEGAGIARTELPGRILKSTEVDLRYHLMQHIIKKGTITPTSLNQWRFVPEEWAKPAIERDRKLLFK